MLIYDIADKDCFKKVLLGCPPKDIDPILKIRIFYKDHYNTQNPKQP